MNTEIYNAWLPTQPQSGDSHWPVASCSYPCAPVTAHWLVPNYAAVAPSRNMTK